MSILTQDVRFAMRMLRKNPLFTAVAILTLALGIGLNSAVFSAIEALLLRPLPGVREPDRLVQLYRSYPGDFEYGANSIPHYVDVRDRNDVFSGVAAWSFVPLNLSSGGRNERILGQMVSANFFSVYGVRAERGRTFVPSEDVGPGAHPVVVISHQLWNSYFAADPDVIGRELIINGHTFSVIGVAPEAFRGPVASVTPALWAPLMMQHELLPGGDRLDARGWNFMDVVARLKPGVTASRAGAAMTTLNARLAEEFPESYKGNRIVLVPQSEAGMHPKFRGAQLAMSSVVMAVVVLLLLLACVNVANLFLARARDRRREMGVRLSLGARRSRLVRQLLTESLLFSLLAGSAGLALAYWTIGLANGIRLPIDVPLRFDLRLSAPVLLFTLAASLATGVVFGLAPALQATRPELLSSLRGEASLESAARSRVSKGLVIAQMALSLVLLLGAGLFLRSLRAATAIDKGFRSDQLLLASVDPGLQGYDRAKTDAFYAELLERVRALPRVRTAAIAAEVPLGLGSQQRDVAVPGYTPAPNERMGLDFNTVGPGYFEAMGIPMLAGRDFTERDDASAPGVVVINQRMAERFWKGESALGKRIRAAGRDYEVVGVVANGKYRSLGEAPLEYVYYPQQQVFGSAMTLHVRTTADPEQTTALLRAEVAALDPTLPVYDTRTMEQHLGITLLPARLAGAVLGLFGLLGLVLATVGIYGVMAYSVSQRTKEIGIRVALGAAHGQVVGLIVGQGLRLILAGTAVGLAASLGAARLVRGLLYGTSALDPLTFVGVPLILLAAAFLATYLPARRAAGVDPLVALKSE